MKNSRLDFSAFAKAPSLHASISESLQSMNNTFSRASGAGRFLYGSAFISIVAAVAFSTILFLISLSDPSAPLFATITFGIMTLTSFSLIGYGFVGYGKRAVVVRTFCKNNGFEYAKNIVLDQDSGKLLGLNLVRYTRNAVKSIGKNRQFIIFDYRYKTGSGRHPSVNLYSVLILNLQKPSPNIVATHKKSNHRHITWGRLGKNFKINTMLDETFKFYGSDTGKDALGKLLQQRSIQQLLENTKACDFEIYNQRLYLFMKGVYKDPVTAERLVNVAQNTKP